MRRTGLAAAFGAAGLALAAMAAFLGEEGTEPADPVPPAALTRSPDRPAARTEARVKRATAPEDEGEASFRRLAGDVLGSIEPGGEAGPEQDLDTLLAEAEGGRSDAAELALALRRRLDRDPAEAIELAHRVGGLRDPTVRFVAIRALAPHSTRPEVADALLALLEHGTPDEREAAPFALLGTADPAVLERLAGIYSDPADVSRVRAASAYVLADSWDALAPDDARRVRKTALAMASDLAASRDLRRESLEVLAVVPLEGSELRRLAESARVERDQGLRLAFLRVLHRPGPGRELPPEVEAAIRSLGATDEGR